MSPATLIPERLEIAKSLPLAIEEKVKPVAESHRDAALELFEQMLDPSKAGAAA